MSSYFQQLSLHIQRDFKKKARLGSLSVGI